MFWSWYILLGITLNEWIMYSFFFNMIYFLQLCRLIRRCARILRMFLLFIRSHKLWVMRHSWSARYNNKYNVMWSTSVRWIIGWEFEVFVCWFSQEEKRRKKIPYSTNFPDNSSNVMEAIYIFSPLRWTLSIFSELLTK